MICPALKLLQRVGALDVQDRAVTWAEVDEVRGCLRAKLSRRDEPVGSGGCSGDRTFRHYRDRFEADGAAGLYDSRLGRAFGAARRGRRGDGGVLDLFDTRYADFTAKHF